MENRGFAHLPSCWSVIYEYRNKMSPPDMSQRLYQEDDVVSGSLCFVHTNTNKKKVN